MLDPLPFASLWGLHLDHPDMRGASVAHNPGLMSQRNTAIRDARGYARTLIGAAIPAGLLVFASIHWWDIPLAQAIRALPFNQARPHHHLLHVPDLLLPLVLVITALAWTGYVLHRRLALTASDRRWLAAVGVVAPLSYLAKSLFKWLFGRVQTRLWLTHGYGLQFHWMHGSGAFNGFPSGHMLVCSALAAIVCRRYPRALLPITCLLTLLAGALLLLEYHFLSDVVAGTYLGLLLEQTLSGRLLHRYAHPTHQPR